MTGPLDDHLSPDALADLLVGEGTDADTAHVGRCPACAGALAELDEAQAAVDAALAGLPPVRLPDGLAARLDAALAAEPPLTGRPDAAAVGGGAALPGDDRADAPEPPARAGSTVVPLGSAPSRRRPLGPRLLGAAAVVALVLAVPLGLSQLPGSSQDDAASPAAGGVAESVERTVPTSASGTDWSADRAVLAAALPEVLQGDPAMRLQQRAAPSAAAEAPSDATADESLAFGAESGRLSSELERLRDPQALADCLSALATTPDEPVEPLAVDYASYGGQAALAVVLPTEDPETVEVFVVGAGCSAEDDQTLFFTRLPVEEPS